MSGIYGNIIGLLESDSSRSSYIKKYQEKLRKISEETGEERIARLSINSEDGSNWQTFNKNEKPRNKYNIKNIIDENTYIISDTHFGKNIENDINKIKTINKIPKDATLLFLGDLGFIATACKDHIKECFDSIECENRFMILGNHDAYSLDFYYDDLGMKGVYDRIYIPKNNWIFSHQPCNGPMDNIINFHGHIHGETNYMACQIARKGRNINLDKKINCWEGYCTDKPRTLKEWIYDNDMYPKNKILIYEEE